ncbi:amidase family protein [uncultured Bradyrhizobium sp.]|jgi:amidase|uniref:amidase family protein n=1 Tax=uncultured Bradyrhizobium sp. TaxID=199684 RepID=UPI002625BDD8|nr:amidase family protein [uncultured Bradyrhizobium sp.]
MDQPIRGDAKAPAMPTPQQAPMSEIIDALAGGRITATLLTELYLARIEAHDRNGPALNSVRALIPEARAIAGERDGIRPSVKRPPAGVPILLKDNIATADKQQTTAGSLALEGARAWSEHKLLRLAYAFEQATRARKPPPER